MIKDSNICKLCETSSHRANTHAVLRRPLREGRQLSYDCKGFVVKRQAIEKGQPGQVQSSESKVRGIYHIVRVASMCGKVSCGLGAFLWRWWVDWGQLRESFDGRTEKSDFVLWTVRITQIVLKQDLTLLDQRAHGNPLPWLPACWN